MGEGHFSTAIRLGDLLSDGATFSVDLDQLVLEDEEEITNDADNSYLDPELLDEDVYTGVKSFDEIAKDMENVLENGGVKKKILKKGYGQEVPDLSEVWVNYNAYLEYNVEPFDSTYARKRLRCFVINDGKVLPGLNIAVQSMKVNEKSQFLIQPDYAYRELGVFNLIPPKSVILFEIELVKFMKATDKNYNDETTISFQTVYEKCSALNLKAKELFNRHCYYKAVREYNTAVYNLENCVVDNCEEQEKQMELLLKLYANLVVCYTKLQKVRKACVMANNIYAMVRGSNLQIPAKVYYNNARCLRLLGDYSAANKRLKLAHKYAPNNSDIAAEFVRLEEDRKKAAKYDEDFSKSYSKILSKEGVNLQFKNIISKILDDLKMNDESMQVIISRDLSESEKTYVENEASKHGFRFNCIKNKGKKQNVIEKITCDSNTD